MHEPRIAGAAGSITALIFVLASFVAASREDPVPLGPPEPLDLGDIDSASDSELVKYGDIEAPDASDIHDLPLSETAWEEEPAEGTAPSEDLFPEEAITGEYEVDDMSESRWGEALGHEESVSPPDPLDPFDEDVPVYEETASSEYGDQESSGPDPSAEFPVPEDWVEETAKVMAYDTVSPEVDRPAIPGDRNVESSPAPDKTAHDFRMRTRYKVLDEVSGKHYGTWYGDEGYSTLEPSSLSELIGSELEPGELRIVKLDWSNFDEVEVHIRMESVMPIDLDAAANDGADDKDLPGTQVPGEPGTEDDHLSPGIEERESTGSEIPLNDASGNAPRYRIYDRRTIQPMGDYTPEGERSRIDRLTLYKMFPEYDFKTFEIDSIRWEENEVRIFIKGERKDSPRGRPLAGSPRQKPGQAGQKKPDKKPRQRDMLEDD